MAYFGDFEEMISLNVEAAQEPFDAVTIRSNLITSVSDNIMETAAYERAFASLRAIQPFIDSGKLNMSANLPPVFMNLYQKFQDVDSQKNLSPDEALYQKRLRVNDTMDKPVPPDNFQQLRGNNGLQLLTPQPATTSLIP